MNYTIQYRVEKGTYRAAISRYIDLTISLVRMEYEISESALSISLMVVLGFYRFHSENLFFLPILARRQLLLGNQY